MIAKSKRNKVIVCAAESFFLMPLARLAQTVRNHGYLGGIGRVVGVADHTRYHNDSCWNAFVRAIPTGHMVTLARFVLLDQGSQCSREDTRPPLTGRAESRKRIREAYE